VTQRRYCAFISYRHFDNSQEGRRWAEWLHRALERYTVPPDLAGTPNLRGEPVRASLYPIFRDEDELPANADLATGIRAALEVSDYMIVLCSPRSAVSPWVRKEVREFKELGHTDRILAAMIAGEPNADDPAKVRDGILREEECFCEELRFGVKTADGTIDWTSRTEPLAADLRPGGMRAEGFVSADAYREHLTLHSALTREKIAALAEAYHERLEHGILKVIAGLLGVTLGQLAERDAAHRAELARKELERSQAEAARLRRFNRFVFVASAAIVLVLLAGIAVSNWQAVRATKAESLATSRLEEARQQTERATKAEALANARLEEANRQTARAINAESISTDRLNQMIAEQKRADQEKANALAAQKDADTQKKAAEAATEREQQLIALFKLPSRGGKSLDGWTVTRIGGSEFVPVGNLADFYRFKQSTREGNAVTLASNGVVCKGATNSPEFLINNVKFILNYPLVEKYGLQFMSRMDLVKTIDPVLRPSYITTDQPIDTVVLDPAKGGSDPGAVGLYGVEKDYTLAFAKQVGALLSKAGFHVVMTRDTDATVSVADRVALANKQKNAILISINFNSAEPSITGVETYALAPQGVPSMAGEGPQDSDLLGLRGNKNDGSNIALATAVHAMVVHSIKIPDRGIRRARFEILRDLTIPAISVVGGFLSNAQDAQMIASTSYKDSLAVCIRDAVTNYRRALQSKPAQKSSKPPADADGETDGAKPAQLRGIDDVKPSASAAKPATTPPTPKPDAEIPVAKAVLGKPGFVHSPFDEEGSLIDVRNMAAGSKVRDPHTNKIFRVP